MTCNLYIQTMTITEHSPFKCIVIVILPSFTTAMTICILGLYCTKKFP